MELNQKQLDYLSGLIEARGNENGYTDEDQYEAFINAVQYMQSSNTNDNQRNDLLRKLGGTWSDFINAGGNSSWRKKATHNAINPDKVKDIWDAYNIAEVKPDKFDKIDDDNVGKIDNSLLAEYGNNFFELITYDETLKGEPYNKKLSLAGVLKDVPSFSMASEWITGPVASVADAVKDWFCSPAMEIFMGIGGKDRSWINMDEGTDRIYSKVAQKPSFNLNFKIYTTENIGSKSLTTWKTWLKALSLYAMPSINNKVSINAMGNQVIEGVNGAFNTVKNVFNATKNSLTSDNDKDMLDKLGDALESAANTAEKHILNRDGPGRVQSTANSESYYGSKIWYLRILPGIFAKPLIVYISNWGVTYSKEINISTGEPIWVEFKITCELDQIPSAPTWMKYLSNDAGENGEIPKTYMHELGKKNLKHSDYIQNAKDLIKENDKHK